MVRCDQIYSTSCCSCAASSSSNSVRNLFLAAGSTACSSTSPALKIHHLVSTTDHQITCKCMAIHNFTTKVIFRGGGILLKHTYELKGVDNKWTGLYYRTGLMDSLILARKGGSPTAPQIMLLQFAYQAV